MFLSRTILRREFLQSASLLSVGVLTAEPWLSHVLGAVPAPRPLEEFGYRDVVFAGGLHEEQLQETHSVLMELNEDSLLKPIRQMVGKPAPGEDLGGWYHYDPDYDSHPGDVGFAPACPFGQWVSALARMHAITGSPQTREKVLRLNRLYAQTISGDFYENNRFPAYCYHKLVCGLI